MISVDQSPLLSQPYSALHLRCCGVKIRIYKSAIYEIKLPNSLYNRILSVLAMFLLLSDLTLGASPQTPMALRGSIQRPGC
jgi:hypothetical protein